MLELELILDERFRSRATKVADAVLVTVVHVRGSSYRRPGARMLIRPDGSRIGSVSGGCLEGDLIKKAWWLTDGARAAIRTYDTSSDEDAVWEFGLGCGGIIRVLLERAGSPSVEEMLRFLEARRQLRESCVVVTAISEGAAARVGDRLLVAAHVPPVGELCDSPRFSELLSEARHALGSRCSVQLQTHGQEYFLEWVGVPLHLVLFGAGHDAIPVVAMARQLGWQVTVADGRSSFARPDRFPGARCMVTGGEGAQLDTDLVDRDTAVVLMTHNYPRDLRLLEQLVPMEPRYLGILGPRDRADRLLADLRDNRIPGTGGAAFREALHAPVGLDLGAETPEAIALSIIAEVQSVFSGRDGSALRTRQGAIHTPPSERVRS